VGYFINTEKSETVSQNLNLSLNEIIKACGKNCVYSGGEFALQIKVPKISIDSRRIQKGELFIVIKGDNFDGHKFVKDALTKGACGAVVENDKLSEFESQFPEAVFLGVENTLKALQDIAHFPKNRFSIPFIAITGSVGKTSTKELTAAVLAGKFNTLKSEKSFNNAIGIPLTLLELRQTHQIVVLEMGTNHFGEIAELCQIAQPQYGVILNIAEAHLEFLGSLKGVLRAKLELFNGLVGEKVGIYNADDPMFTGQNMLLNKTKTFGVDSNADIKGSFQGLNNTGGAKFSIDKTSIQLKISGRHNMYNALAAAAVGFEFGLSIDEIKNGLESIERFPDRSDIRVVSGVKIIDDVYNSNLRSTVAALNLLNELKSTSGGRRIAVLADMLELGDFSIHAHRKVGKYIAEYGIEFLLTFDNEAAHITTEAEKNGCDFCWHFNDKGKLLEKLIEIVQPDDLVLVKGSRGMQMEDVVAGLIQSLDEETG